ncbi:hypothetical protein P7C70_g2811, partial [Phenoliferia sp. Uapishka_3]
MAELEAINLTLPSTSSTPIPPASVGIDLLAGTISGWAQVFTGQPFDIVKVRLQSSDNYKGTMDCATRILREEGPTAFYKGTIMPLVGIGACVSLQFAGLQAGKRAFTLVLRSFLSQGVAADLRWSPFVNASTFVVFELTMRVLT